MASTTMHDLSRTRIRLLETEGDVNERYAGMALLAVVREARGIAEDLRLFSPLATPPNDAAISFLEKTQWAAEEDQDG